MRYPDLYCSVTNNMRMVVCCQSPSQPWGNPRHTIRPPQHPRYPAHRTGPVVRDDCLPSFFRTPTFPYQHRVFRGYFLQYPQKSCPIFHNFNLSANSLNLRALGKILKLVSDIKYPPTAEAHRFIDIKPLKIRLKTETNDANATL